MVNMFVACFVAAISLYSQTSWGSAAAPTGHHHLSSRSDDVNTLALAQSRLAEDMQALQAKFLSLEAKVASLSTPLAFTAETGGDKHYDDGATVTFGRVLVNEGLEYNAHTGVVTVPQDGLYLVNVRSDPGNLSVNHVTLDLKVNGAHQFSAYGEHGSTGSASGTLRLHAGDHVTVTKQNGDLSNLGHAAMLSVVRISV